MGEAGAGSVCRSRRFRRPLKLSHVSMQNGLLTTTVPLDRLHRPNSFPVMVPLVGIIFLPADFVADF